MMRSPRTLITVLDHPSMDTIRLNSTIDIEGITYRVIGFGGTRKHRIARLRAPGSWGVSLLLDMTDRSAYTT